MMRLTPYQGRHRQFGCYRCMRCGRFWESANSWANKGQRCRVCFMLVYPFKQLPLAHSSYTYEMIANHPRELCQMCQEKGSLCTFVY